MKIKVLILTNDEQYTSRVLNIINRKYADKLQVYCFSNPEDIQKQIITLHPDVLVLDEEYAGVTIEDNPSYGIACFADNKRYDSIYNHRVIAKYQEVSVICAEIFDVFSEYQRSLAASLNSGRTHSQKVITFLSPVGGVGTTTISLAMAQKLAEKGENVLYLNLQPYENTDVYFDGNGNYSFRRVLDAIEMGSLSTKSKIENALRRDSRGVYYFGTSEVALDILSMTDETYENLFRILNSISYLDWIVVEIPCEINKCLLDQVKRSLASIIITDARESSINKVNRFYQALSIMATSEKEFPLSRMYQIYNRFSSRTQTKPEKSSFKEIGTMANMKNADFWEIIRYMNDSKVFDYFLANE